HLRWHFAHLDPTRFPDGEIIFPDRHTLADQGIDDQGKPFNMVTSAGHNGRDLCGLRLKKRRRQSDRITRKGKNILGCVGNKGESQRPCPNLDDLSHWFLCVVDCGKYGVEFFHGGFGVCISQQVHCHIAFFRRNFNSRRLWSRCKVFEMYFLKVFSEVLAFVNEMEEASNGVTVEGIRLKSLLVNDVTRLED